MSLKGMPDWSQPLRGGGSDLYFAYEEPQHAYASPLGLRVATGPDGAPALALELIRLNGGAQGPQVFGLLTIRFANFFDLAERQQNLFAIHSGVKLEPLVPTGGFLRFQAAEALNIPDELLTPRPLVWAGAGSLTFAAQLGQAATSLLNDALVNGIVTVTALAEVETWGLARRFPAQVKFNPAMLTASLDEVAIDGRCTPAAVAAMLAGLNDTSFFSFEGVTTDTDRIAAATACTERLIGRFAKLTPTNDPGSGPTFAFDTATLADGEIVWDLSGEVLVPRGLILASNPLATARQAIASGFSLTRDAPVVQFATGLHVLTLYPNLPLKRVGVLLLSTEIRVPPFPPDRPQTVTASVTFREGDTSRTLPIRLSPNEKLVFDYQSVAFINTGGGVQRLVGPTRHHESRHLTLSPDTFPIRFVRIEATPPLLALVTLDIQCIGQRGETPWSARAVLDRATDALAIAVPRDVTGTLAITATALEGDRTRSLDVRPLEDCWLDLSSFPTAGPAGAVIECAFDDETELAAIECVPEDRLDDAEAIGLVRLTPANAMREWRWLVTNPLQDGFYWRWFRHPDETPASWSGRVDPGAGPLTLKSSSRPVAASAVMEDMK